MKLTLIEKREETLGVTSFVWKPETPVAWQAGQYLHYTLPHPEADNRGEERWFTIASAPYEGAPMITTRFAAERGSTFKAALARLSEGDTIDADSPEGDFTINDEKQEYVFLAGGIGITPFHAILKEADHGRVQLKITLIYANRDENVPYKTELDAYANRNPDINIIYLTSPQRIDENSIKKYVSDIKKPMIYISGPEPMVKSLATVVEKMGAPATHVKLDDFPGYEDPQPPQH